MLKIIEKDKVDYSILYKIEKGLTINEMDKIWVERNFSPRIAYKLALNRCELYKLKKYEEECIKDSYWAYCFARFIQEANIEKCQETACKYPSWAYYFALNIKGANIEICQEAACKAPEWAFCFARDIKCADIKKCQEAATNQSFFLGTLLCRYVKKQDNLIINILRPRKC